MKMWESVFWDENNVRPDKITKTLNEHYNKSDRQLKDVIKEVVKASDTSIWENSGETTLFSWFTGKAKKSGSKVFDAMSTTDQEKFVHDVLESRNVSEWEGEAFRPKSLQLTRVNLAVLRGKSTIGVMQVKVAKSISELTTRINILDAELKTGVHEMIDDLHARLRNLTRHMAATGEEQVRQLRALVPVGTIISSVTKITGPGWLLCNGSEIDALVYPELKLLVGPRTPDLQMRFLMGADNVTGVRTKGGEKEHILSVEEMPSHNHNYILPRTNATQHNTTLPLREPLQWAVQDQNPEDSGQERAGTYTGESKAHNNMPPYYAVQFYIRG